MKLHWKIIIGMALGVIFGLIMSQTSFGSDLIKDWVKPFGTIFINLLKLIAMPLILASLVKGISDLKDISKLSTIGTRTLGIYICTTVTAVIIGLILVNIVEPGGTITEETRIDLVQEYEQGVIEKQQQAQQQAESGPLQPLVDIVPPNIFDAATNNRNMLQVIFFAIFFGIGIILVDPKLAKPVKDFFDGLNSIILKLIDLIMESAPYGVFALLATLVVESPSLDLFIALGMYSVTLIIGLILMIVVYNIIVKLITNTNPSTFMKGISAAQLLGFSTSSSAATLPVTMDCAEKNLGVDKEISSFVLPIGATVNMDGTSVYQAVAAVFIAQAFGLDLSLGAQLGIIVTATLASIGAAAVPSAGIVMLVIVLGQAGIPEAGLALIIAVDRPLDMCRTIVNVTGDAAVSMIVAKSVGKLKDPKDVNKN